MNEVYVVFDDDGEVLAVFDDREKGDLYMDKRGRGCGDEMVSYKLNPRFEDRYVVGVRILDGGKINTFANRLVEGVSKEYDNMEHGHLFTIPERNIWYVLVEAKDESQAKTLGKQFIANGLIGR